MTPDAQSRLVATPAPRPAGVVQPFLDELSARVRKANRILFWVVFGVGLAFTVGSIGELPIHRAFLRSQAYAALFLLPPGLMVRYFFTMHRSRLRSLLNRGTVLGGTVTVQGAHSMKNGPMPFVHVDYIDVYGRRCVAKFEGESAAELPTGTQVYVLGDRGNTVGILWAPRVFELANRTVHQTQPQHG